MRVAVASHAGAAAGAARVGDSLLVSGRGGRGRPLGVVQSQRATVGRSEVGGCLSDWSCPSVCLWLLALRLLIPPGEVVAVGGCDEYGALVGEVVLAGPRGPPLAVPASLRWLQP